MWRFPKIEVALRIQPTRYDRPLQSNNLSVISAFTEMCSGSEAGSHLRFIDYVYHSTLGLRVMKKRREKIFASGLAIALVKHRFSCISAPKCVPRGL